MRAQLQSLPGSPAQAGRLAALHAEAADLKSKVAKMEAKAVPRPAPPQYAQVLQSVQHFLAGSGSMQRMQSLLVHLEVGSSYCMLHEFCHAALPEQCVDQPVIVLHQLHQIARHLSDCHTPMTSSHRSSLLSCAVF